MQTRIYNMRRSQGYSHYIKWVCVVLIQCPQGLFQDGRTRPNADRSAVLSERRNVFRSPPHSLFLFHSIHSQLFSSLFSSLSPFSL